MPSEAMLWGTAILFGLVGVTLVIVGIFWLPMLALVGLPFQVIGFALLGMLFYGHHAKRQNRERYAVWLRWVNLVAGIIGAAVFALPALLAIPVLLLLGLSDLYWLGALFSFLGAATVICVVFLARYQIQHWPQPSDDSDSGQDDAWNKDAFEEWIERHGQDDE